MLQVWVLMGFDELHWLKPVRPGDSILIRITMAEWNDGPFTTSSSIIIHEIRLKIPRQRL